RPQPSPHEDLPCGFRLFCGPRAPFFLGPEGAWRRRAARPKTLRPELLRRPDPRILVAGAARCAISATHKRRLNLCHIQLVYSIVGRGIGGPGITGKSVEAALVVGAPCRVRL